jgi:hypothetical protein
MGSGRAAWLTFAECVASGPAPQDLARSCCLEQFGQILLSAVEQGGVTLVHEIVFRGNVFGAVPDLQGGQAQA